MRKITLAEAQRRFDASVDRSGECHEWIARHYKHGYGSTCCLRQRLAHRLAWVLAHGTIPEGMHVLHRCDNRRCVRLDHLFLGTAKDNIHDMMAKGRANFVGPRGERQALAKLTAGKVVEIRSRHASGESFAALSRTFDVASQTIQSIVKRRTWKHIP